LNSPTQVPECQPRHCPPVRHQQAKPGDGKPSCRTVSLPITHVLEALHLLHLLPDHLEPSAQEAGAVGESGDFDGDLSFSVAFLRRGAASGWCRINGTGSCNINNELVRLCGVLDKVRDIGGVAPLHALPALARGAEGDGGLSRCEGCSNETCHV
jgi:hypothetical protein